MAISKVSGGDPVPDASVKSQAPALALTARNICGRNHMLRVLATGKNPFPKQVPAMPRNPQGRLGHDHSGAPWGSSFLHPIAWAFGRNTTANVTGERQLVTGITSSNTRSMPPWFFWVPPFDALPAPLVAPRAMLHLLLFAETNAGTSDLTVTLRSHESRNPTPGETTKQFAITTTETAFSADELYLDAVPGYNRADITFEGSHATNEIMITALALCVVVKRSH